MINGRNGFLIAMALALRSGSAVCAADMGSSATGGNTSL